MKFEDSSLYFEFSAIVNGERLPVFYQVGAILHAKEDDVDITRVISIDTKRDYELDFAEEITISCFIPAGTYVKRIYQNRNELEMSVIVTPIDNLTGLALSDEERIDNRYVAILREDISSPVIESQVNAEIDEETLNRADMLSVSFQLIDKNIYELRMATVGGAYRNTTNGDLIKSLLTIESNKTNVPNEFKCLGVEMVPPNNISKRSHLIIPHGTKITYLPQYVHEECGGVYSTGFGYFYQDRNWYVYPLYDTKRFDSATDTLIAVNLPANSYPGLTKTYRFSGNSLVVLLSGETKFEDRSDQNDLTLGNGVRFSDASKFMEGYVTVKNNEALVDRSKNATEVVIEGRKDKKNFVPMSNVPIRSNVYVQYSAMANRGISIIQAVWESANPKYLKPGMPVKFLYLDKDEVVELQGVLLKVHAYTHTLEKTMFASKFVTNVNMVIGVERSPTLNEA